MSQGDRVSQVGQTLRYPVAATTTITVGTFVGLNVSGYARGLSAGDAFLGLALATVDNSGGGNGDLSVPVATAGEFDFTLTSAAQGDLHRPVFLSDSTTLTFAGAGNSFCGFVTSFPAANRVKVSLRPGDESVKTVRYQVADLGAGADLALTAIHEFDQEGWIVGVRIVNGSSAAAGIDNSNTCVVTITSGALTVASKIYNASVTFPSANTADDLGTPINPRLTSGEILTVAVTNGTTANPGAFTIEVDYV